MSGWTRKALEVALGPRYHDRVEDLPQTGGQRMRTLTWTCDGATVVATKTLTADYYALDVSCSHRGHYELAQYPLIRVTHFEVRDAAANPVKTLPHDTAGYRLSFGVDGPLLQYAPTVRVESAPDLEGPGLDFVEEWNAGTYAPGATYEVILAGNAHRDRELSIHVLEPQAAQRDWGDHGVIVFRKRVMVG